MEAPPPYMPPPKKKNTGLIVGLIIGGVLLCCIAPIGLLVGGGLWAFNQAMPIAGCGFAFEDARDALVQYAKDNNGQLPPAANWQDAAKPYYDKIVAGQLQERGPIKSMPSSGAWGCENGRGGRTGMAFNETVAGKTLDEVEKADEVLLFETPQSTPSAHMPYSAQSDTGSPTIMGQPRGWFLIRVNGDPRLMNKGREQKMDMGPRGG